MRRPRTGGRRSRGGRRSSRARWRSGRPPRRPGRPGRSRVRRRSAKYPASRSVGRTEDACRPATTRDTRRRPCPIRLPRADGRPRPAGRHRCRGVDGHSPVRDGRQRRGVGDDRGNGCRRLGIAGPPQGVVESLDGPPVGQVDAEVDRDVELEVHFSYVSWAG